MRTFNRASKLEKGAVSIFVVIFALLFVAVITVSFIRIMLQEQEQASNNDLSQSALDSAMSAVEDGKRVLLSCQRAGLDPSSSACRAIQADKCDTVSSAGVVPQESGEVKLKTSSGSGTDLAQAYTCVLINASAPDYRFDGTASRSSLVSLQSKGDVNKVNIRWQLPGDKGNLSSSPLISRAGGSSASPSSVELFAQDKWSNAPALLRVQLINPGTSLSSASLDQDDKSGTLFLYPAAVGGVGTTKSTIDLAPVMKRATATSYHSTQPSPIICSSARYAASGFACEVDLTLGSNIIPTGTNAFLRITPMYRDATVSVRMYNDTNLVQYSFGQSIIDATGRANNLFRRVEARVDNNNSLSASYPENAVDITGSLCKHFLVSSATAVAETGMTCTP